jgi:hypothetical protein
MGDVCFFSPNPPVGCPLPGTQQPKLLATLTVIGFLLGFEIRTGKHPESL